jgi:hypothetical protein
MNRLGSETEYKSEAGQDQGKHLKMLNGCNISEEAGVHIKEEND